MPLNSRILAVTQEAATRLYLVVGADAAPDRIGALLDAADVGALLVVPTDGAQFDAATLKPLVDAAQQREVAAILEGDAQLVRTLRADGVHLPAGKDIVERYGEARDILGNRFIVGVDAGRTRHDAMTLGEAGADYIGFGIPAHVEDRDTARARRQELVAWWSEIFEVPCVAFDVDALDDASALAAAGADFVALTAPADAPASWIEAGTQALTLPEAAA
jgi:thiamine-phosphate pyrophosphorylase